ncbi:MAG: amidohydrolase family protein [Silvibacterium sp.]
MKRRSFLRTSALLTGALYTGQSSALVPQAMPVIDTHIHFFDPTRASGVPWPKPDDEVLYKPALPERYRQVSKGFGVVGAIAIEASPLLEDNDWLLGVAEKDPMIVGIIGDLVPDCATFGAALERLHRTPLFLGLRYGNLWDRNLTADIGKPGFIDGLRLLSDAKLVFESANPTPELIQTLADLAEKIPELTIVVDHLPHGTIPAGDSAKNIYLRNLARLGGSRRVFIKLSEILHEKDGGVVTDLEAYQGVLDELWQIFGEDKVMYGSDWPNSDHLAPYAETIRLLRKYVARKGLAAQEKFFWRNSLKAYGWKPRSPAQRALIRS